MIRRRSLLAKGIGLALMTGVVAFAGPAPGRPDDDAEEKQERREESRRAFVENCLMCHGEDMTTRQRLTPKQWGTEVEKMVNWGAPLPPDRKQPLIDYLAETYPVNQPAPAPERITPARVLELDRQDPLGPVGTVDVAKGGATYAMYCAACHGPGGRGAELGTNLVERPVLLREDEFRAILHDGRRRMPGFASVLGADGQAEVLAWLRERR